MSTIEALQVRHDLGSDVYLGTPETLIAAGLLTAEQVPGWPGLSSTSATFYDGQRVERYRRVPHDERWMQVTRTGSKVRVTKGLGTAEKRKRQAEKEEAERLRPKPDIGRDAAFQACMKASALFNVGDKVWNGGNPMVVTGEYMLRCVRSKHGEFIDSASQRINYQHGYTCQYRNGEEFFFEAGDLTDEAGEPTLLRLVVGQGRSRS
jgi:hypothetical protein